MGRWGGRVRDWAGRAVRTNGTERQTLMLAVKGTLAATVAWYVADDLIMAEAPAFAPFSAVLIMQVTVYQSLVQALRYVGAVCAGVAAQGALGLVFGPGLVTFALVALVALVIGQWRRLGAQRTQVTTAAFFAFSMYVTATGTPERFAQLGQIILLVLVGCGIGVTVNVVLVPPMRYHGAEYGVRALAGALGELIGDIAPALRDGELDAERTGDLRQRAARLRPITDQARASLDTARESLYLNPRRLFSHRVRRATFTGYEELLAALQRITYQVGSLARCLDQSADGATGPGGRAFLDGYADLLDRLAHVIGVLAELGEDRIAAQAGELREATEEAERARTRLAEASERDALPLGDPTLPYGVLLVEATRLTEEFRRACAVLNRLVSPRSVH